MTRQVGCKKGIDNKHFQDILNGCGATLQSSTVTGSGEKHAIFCVSAYSDKGIVYEVLDMVEVACAEPSAIATSVSMQRHVSQTSWVVRTPPPD